MNDRGYFYEDKQCNKVTPNVTWWQFMPCYTVSPVFSSVLHYIKCYLAGSNEVTTNQHNNKLS